jgi:hypothetical protein
LVARAGQKLYGEEWASPLARDLNLNERTMRRIKAAAAGGDPYPVASGVIVDLGLLADRRSRELADLAAEAQRWVMERGAYGAG